MMKGFKAPLVAVLAAGLLGTGCGGGEEEATTEQPALSKEDYLSEADAVCARVNQDLESVQNFREEGPPIIEQGLDELQGAGGPPQQDPFKQFTKLAEAYGFEGGCTRNQG